MNKKKKITILLLGGARRVSMAELLKKSGERYNLDIEIVSYELMEQVPIACIGKVEIGLKWTDPNVVDDIVRVATEYEAGIILPFVDGAIEIAAKCKERLPDVFIPVSDFDICRKLFDKVEAAKIFKDAKLAIPKTYSVLNAEVPAIAKPRYGSASRGIKVFRNIEDLMHLENIQDYLVQEFLEEMEEFTVDCYVSQQGEILTIVPRRRLEIMGGEVTRTETVRNEELEKLATEALKAFNLRGPVTLQYLHDLRKDRFLLMEINPRLGGGVVCSIYAGAPITDYILCEKMGIPVQPCNDWVNNTLMARYQKEVIFFNK